MMGVLWYALIPGYYPPFVPHGLPRLVAMVLYMLPFGILGGFIYGRWMWRRFERNTQDLEEKAKDGAPA